MNYMYYRKSINCAIQNVYNNSVKLKYTWQLDVVTRENNTTVIKVIKV